MVQGPIIIRPCEFPLAGQPGDAGSDEIAALRSQ